MRGTGVLIAGGGVSGLTAAFDLHRLGVDCTVAERSSRLGGLIFTDARDGFVMDGGPDAFLTQKPQALELCAELGLADRIIPTNPDQQKVYVLHRGTLRALPAGMRLTVATRWLPLAVSDLFTWRGKLRMLCERWQPPRADDDVGDEGESVASFVTRRFGRECFERVGEPLLAGIHCGDANRLSMDELFPRLVEMEKRYGSVTRGMAAAGTSRTAFASLAGGMGELIEALRRKLPDEAVLLESGVDAVRADDDGFEATMSSGEPVRARAVVLALPIFVTRDLVRAGFPAIAATLDRIPTVSSAIVFHAFAREDVDHPLDGYGFVVPKGEPNRLLAATFITSKFTGRAPDSHVLIRTFVGGGNDPNALSLSDSELIALSRSELARAIGPLGKPTMSEVVRWPDRTPQVELGHKKVLAALDEQLANIPGLYVLGSGLKSVGIPDTIGQARATATDVAAFIEKRSSEGLKADS